MLAVLKIRHRNPQKPRPAFTLQPRGRFAFTWPKQRALRALTLSPTLRGRSTLRSRRAVSSRRSRTQAEAFSGGGFTLVEFLVVMGIIIILTALLAPAFTTLKSAGDVTNAAYTMKGMLDQARTYAMANNTYTSVGFAGSIGTTALSVTGQVMLAAFASNDGTQGGLSSGNYRQLGKLVKLDNAHIGDTGVPTSDGTEFESRANVASQYRISSAGAGAYTITAQQTSFTRWIQFSPRGETVVNGNTSITQYAEIGIQPTHGAALAVSQDANGKWVGNIVAVQISGIAGNVKIYRR